MLRYIPKVRLRLIPIFVIASTVSVPYEENTILIVLAIATLLKIKLLEEHLQTQVSSTKSAFESNLLKSLQSNDCTKVYSYIRSVTGQNTSPRCLHLNNTSADILIKIKPHCLTGTFTLLLQIVHFPSLISLPNICDLLNPILSWVIFQLARMKYLRQLLPWIPLKPWVVMALGQRC